METVPLIAVSPCASVTLKLIESFLQYTRLSLNFHSFPASPVPSSQASIIPLRPCVRLSCTTHPHPLPHTPTLTNHFCQSIRAFWLSSPAWINILFTRKRDRHQNDNKDPFLLTQQQYLWTAYPSISSDRNPSLQNTLQKGKNRKKFSKTDC